MLKSRKVRFNAKLGEQALRERNRQYDAKRRNMKLKANTRNANQDDIEMRRSGIGQSPQSGPRDEPKEDGYTDSDHESSGESDSSAHTDDPHSDRD